MKIFIQGRKNGNKPLYPKPTPAEFYSWAEDIQRSDAPNNAQCYGKSLYSIAFNGNGCIFTKYIIGYDTLREYIGNIGISIFIAANQKMSGVDIKNLLDELIKIYTTNYCPDFKINNQKQEDWLLFQSAADSYNSKVKIISADENYQYGNKDAAYVFYNSTSLIEKYLDAPYQEEYKEYKQIFFIENQSQLILEVIKHDQIANLTSKIDLENPSYKLRDYHGQGKDGVSIEIRANGILRRGGEKIFRKDNISIKYSKKYLMDILEEGKLSDPQIAKYLKIYDSSVDVEKNIELKPTEIPVEISINDSKGNKINNAIITCKKSNYPNTEKLVSQNTIVFSGEEQKDRWTISAREDYFSGEETFIPEHKSIVKLTLREVKKFIIQVAFGNNILKTENRIYYDDDIRKERTEIIEFHGFHAKPITFIPKNIFDNYPVILEKKVNQPQTTQGHKGYGSTDDKGEKPPRKRPYIKILIVSSIACILVVGVYFLVGKIWGNDIKVGEETPAVLASHTLTPAEIQRYVEGDSLFLDKLNKYKEDWANLKNTTDNKKYKKYDESLDRAIKKREAITNHGFGFLKDSANFIGPQMSFKNALDKINENQCEQVKTKLGDVSKLTLTQIADSINKILGQINDQNATTVRTNTPSNIEPIKKKEEEIAAASKKAKEAVAKPKADVDADNDEINIINYLKGNVLKIDKLNEYMNSSVKNDDIKKDIQLALDFWSLDGTRGKSYSSYKSKVAGAKYLKSNQTLKIFVDKANNETKYPKGTSGAGKTLTLSKFIEQTK